MPFPGSTGLGAIWSGRPLGRLVGSGKLQRPMPCRAPPPHLSPFVAEEEEGYMPEYGRQLKQLQEAARAARKRRAGALIEGSFLEAKGEGGKGGEAGTVGEPEDELAAAEARHTAELAKELKVGGEWEGCAWGRLGRAGCCTWLHVLGG